VEHQLLTLLVVVAVLTQEVVKAAAQVEQVVAATAVLHKVRQVQQELQIQALAVVEVLRQAAQVL
jgi:hypothetical protein